MLRKLEKNKDQLVPGSTSVRILKREEFGHLSVIDFIFKILIKLNLVYPFVFPKLGVKGSFLYGSKFQGKPRSNLL